MYVWLYQSLRVAPIRSFNFFSRPFFLHTHSVREKFYFASHSNFPPRDKEYFSNGSAAYDAHHTHQHDSHDVKENDEKRVRTFASGHTGHINLSRFPIDPNAVERVPAKVVLHYKFMPLEIRDGILKIAVNSLNNITLFDDLRIFLQLEIVPFLARDEDIIAAINKYYGIGAETIEDLFDGVERQAAIHEIAADPSIAEITRATKDRDDEAAISKFVNKIFFEAYDARATDIHIEPYEEKLRIRYRVDGNLVRLNLPQELSRYKSSIISRIKIMSHLDIAEKRLPQDGRLKVKINERKLDMRVSTLPTPYGESVNIRLLTSKIGDHLGALGFEAEDILILNRRIAQSHGIILVTGPTGSGKTSTLYTCLSTLNKENRKIITIEDPIEYNLEGVTQMQVKPKIGFDFARGLRSILRHDPDVILIGEIRDSETAEIALRSSLTGHLVFSTLHTNSASQALTRLMDMGMERYLIADSLECVVAQRLVRVICPHCKISVQLTEEDKKRFVESFSGMPLPNSVFCGIGCPECNNTGYRGRSVIYEIIVVDDHIKNLIYNNASADQIHAAAVNMGMKSLHASGYSKVLRGITTVEELFNVVN
jgi:type II secretory ATPase GspE/PulE/Tfp pilus assembly ATPase PilB-like protein